MKTIIAKPSNKEQLTALKAVMKLLKIDFTIETSPYNSEFLLKVERAEAQIKSDKYRKITSSQLWK